MPKRVPFAQRLLRNIIIDDDCWLWAGWTTAGYGRITTPDRRAVQAHRAVYELLVGPIPADLHLDHLCHNADTTCPGGHTCPHRRCVNPAHLEPVTPQVNSKRGRTGVAGGAKTGAWHRAKTRCPQGHLYDAANTRVRRDGSRACRRCEYLKHREARTYKREERAHA